MLKLPTIDPALVASEIEAFIVERVREFDKKGIVIGISGGIDSAVASVLCRRAFQNLDLEVHGLIVPGSASPEAIQDTNDAKELCNKFNIKYDIIDISNIILMTAARIDNAADEILNKVAAGNMASRIRMNILHTVAEIKNSLVCGTGNEDEDFGIGYYTLFGDGAVHMSPIGDLSKRLVYEMGYFLGIPDSIMKKQPSARLEDGQTDFGDLGYGYDVVEYIMICQCHQEEKQTLKDIEHFYYNKEKFKTTEELYNDVMKRHNIALKKGGLVNPQICFVTKNL